MKPFAMSKALEAVRATTPLVHCITNYVTVNDCANALLACGGSPIMSDEPQDVEDITSICGGLVLNIGTLNEQSIKAMKLSGAVANKLGKAVVLDPVGAGASTLRTQTASELLNTVKMCAVRGNMSEIKALAGAATATRGVDANPEDTVTRENLLEAAKFAREFAERTGAVVAITGAIDVIADSKEAWACFNGVEMMSRITGSGCMLSCMLAAYETAYPEDPLAAALAAIAGMGIAGEIAQARMVSAKAGNALLQGNVERRAEKFGYADGNATFRTYLLDALYNLDGETLETRAKVEKVKL